MIEVINMTKRFGSIEAVKGISFHIEQGEIVGFLGPNGAGKTTTIRMLSGIIGSTSGYAIVAGQRTDGSIEKLHEVIGLLTETPGFYNRLSAYRNLEYYGGFYEKIDVAVQVEKYLKIMGLWERRGDPVGAFSKGMKQRLALARALLHEPGVLFLDEPTAGLDPEASGEVRKLIKDLSVEGRTIFLSTHNLTEAEQLCKRIAVFRTHLIALDTPEKLRASLFSRRVVIRLEEAGDSFPGILGKLPFVKSVKQDGKQLIVELRDTEKELPDLVQNVVQNGGRVIEVTEQHHSLEEVYLSLVREGSKL